MAVCILIPAFNAEKTIAGVISECRNTGYALVVVDDGSTDATPDILKGLEGSAVTLLRHAANRGKGAALKTGFAWALENGYDGVMTIDADGQHDVSAVERVTEAARLYACGILIASRHSQFEEMAGLRKIWNRIGVWCIRRLTGFEINDSQSGFRFYSTDLLRSVTLESDGYALEMEILIKAWKLRFPIVSIPVAARIADGRSTSHYRPVRDTVSISMTFLRYM